MAKVKIVNTETGAVTVLKGKRIALFNFLSTLTHSLGPVVSRGSLAAGGVHIETPIGIVRIKSDGLTDCSPFWWYAEELPSLKAERRRLAKKLNKKDAAENESTRAELSGR